MSKSYEEGRAYRANLGSRATQSSTPASEERPLAPITRHASRPIRHVETVGHVPNQGTFREATHPNSTHHTGTDRFYAPPVETKPFGTLNRVAMKPKS